MESSTKKKIIVYSIVVLVFTSIFLASYFDEDNNLRDEAIKMGDTYYCEKIQTGFIKKKCFEVVERKLALLEECHKEHGEFSKECNNLAY